MTASWWEERSKQFSLYVSQVVIDEISAGNKQAAGKRLGLVKKIAVLDVSDDVIELAAHLVPQRRSQKSLCKTPTMWPSRRFTVWTIY